MRFIELFEDSAEQAKLKSLVKSTSDDSSLLKIVNYLKAKVSKQQAKEPTPADQTVTNEDIAGVKEQALQLIDQISDPAELEKLISFLRRSEITTLSSRVIQQQLGSIQGDLDKKLAAMLGRVKNPFEEKLNFLNKILQSGGIFDGASLLNNKYGNVYELTKSDPVADILAKPMSLEFRGQMGYGPDQGPGEIMMAVLGKNIGLARKGDLVIIGNTTVEVKATGKSKSGLSGGRLYSTTGYGSSSNIKKMVYPLMLEQGIPADVLSNYGWPVKKENVDVIAGGLNLNISGLKNLSNLFQQYTSQAGAKQIIAAILDGLYTKLPSGLSDSVLNLVQADGSFDNKKFLVELTKLAHKYYKEIEGHDALMLYNTDNGNYAIIDDDKEFDDLFNSGKIALTSHLDWSDDRAKGSSQLIIK